MTPRVELVYFEGCPHVEEARARVRRALHAAGLDVAWEERDTGRAETPATYRRFASPTVLVDGRVCGDATEGTGARCAIGGAPAVEVIVRALGGVGR